MFDTQIRSISSVADDIERNGDREGAEYLRNDLDEDIKQCMVDILKVASDALSLMRCSLCEIAPYYLATCLHRFLILFSPSAPTMHAHHSPTPNRRQLCPSLFEDKASSISSAATSWCPPVLRGAVDCCC